MHQSQKPVIAIVGRPNVGKSTLFNRLVGRQAAIVEDFAGVTRDRNYGDGYLGDKEYIVIDTGGFEPEATDDMLKAMRLQASIAIDEADVVICVFDGREGLLPSDEEIVRMLERSPKPTHYAVNKIDGAKHDPLVAEFWSAGVSMIWPVSAQHGSGVYDLMEAVVEDFPDRETTDDPDDPGIAVAVIGKPNAGKSTLVNRLLGTDRLLVGPIPGTTRDSIDSVLEREPDQEAIAEAKAAIEEEREAQRTNEDEERNEEDDAAYLRHLEETLAQAERSRRYLIIDTAGVRRRKWIKTRLERYSIVRSFKSIDRADVCLLLIDAGMGVTEQDAKLAGLIQAKGRGCIILVNKWDTIAEKNTHTAGEFVKQIREDLKFIPYAPILFISALTGQRVHRILGVIDNVKRNYDRRIRTGEVNRLLKRVLETHTPPFHKGKTLKIYYASQVSTGPPTFVLSVNNRDSVHFSYERFLYNQVRAAWDFEGTPIRLVLRDKRQSR